MFKHHPIRLDCVQSCDFREIDNPRKKLRNIIIFFILFYKFNPSEIIKEKKKDMNRKRKLNKSHDRKEITLSRDLTFILHSLATIIFTGKKIPFII